MNPVNIGNLENILNRFWSGELEHNQKEFFCGTVCCLAGWDVVLNSGHKVAPEDREMVWEEGDESGAFSLPWDWSMKNNGLRFSEAMLLFSENSTRGLHELVLEAFKAGRRFEGEDTIEVQPYGDKGYNSPCVSIVVYSDFSHQAVIDFLGESEKVKIKQIAE